MSAADLTPSTPRPRVPSGNRSRPATPADEAELNVAQRTALEYLRLETARLRSALDDLDKDARLARNALDDGRHGTLGTHRLAADAADVIDREARQAAYREACALLGIPEHLIDAASIPVRPAP